MRAVAAVGRFWAFLILSLLLQVRAPLLAPIAAWSNYWVTHRASIMMLTVVNTSITISSEAGARFLWPVVTGEHEHNFFVQTESGATTIHRQSLINIFMTFFASLVGGPVYFIRRGANRFLFFLSFGMVNSMLSQSLVTFVRDGFVSFALHRLWFDFFYNGTVKFFMFELSRRPILNRRKSIRGVGTVTAIRSVQDFLTTAFRVAMLNLFGLKG